MDYEPLTPDQGDYTGSSTKLFSMTKRENDFLTTLYDYQEAISRLKHTLNGDEMDDEGLWIINQDKSVARLNKQGISWVVSTLNSWTGKYYVATHYNKDEIKTMLLPWARQVNFFLHKNWKTFDFKNKLDISVVVYEMVSIVRSILQGTAGDGQRRLLGETNQNVTHRSVNDTPQGFFNRNRGGNLNG